MFPQARLRAKAFDSMATFRGLTVIVGCHSLAEQAEQSNIYCWGWIEKQELCACVCVHAWEVGLVYHRARYEGCQHLLLLFGSPWRRPAVMCTGPELTTCRGWLWSFLYFQHCWWQRYWQQSDPSYLQVRNDSRSVKIKCDASSPCLFWTEVCSSWASRHPQFSVL